MHFTLGKNNRVEIVNSVVFFIEKWGYRKGGEASLTPHTTVPHSAPHTSQPLTQHPTHHSPSLSTPYTTASHSAPHTPQPLTQHPTHDQMICKRRVICSAHTLHYLLYACFTYDFESLNEYLSMCHHQCVQSSLVVCVFEGAAAGGGSLK